MRKRSPWRGNKIRRNLISVADYIQGLDGEER